MEVTEQERLVAILKERYDDQVEKVETIQEFLTLTLKKENIADIIQYLYHHPETKFQFLTTLFAVHYPDLNQIAIVYQLHNLVSNQRLRLKVYLPIENPTIKTITTVFAGANWMERETYDFFGVNFEGHPDLRRILNVEDMIIFPLRKEYPLEDQTREDKSDKMFGR
ncbi:MAG TPA: NADH-quinone oxidoreductase subunit C [Ohtaekwangia sp.]